MNEEFMLDILRNNTVKMKGTISKPWITQDMLEMGETTKHKSNNQWNRGILNNEARRETDDEAKDKFINV